MYTTKSIHYNNLYENNTFFFLFLSKKIKFKVEKHNAIRLCPQPVPSYLRPLGWKTSDYTFII